VTFRERVQAAFFKVLPIGCGLILGWLIVSPPAFLRSLGWASYLVMAVLGFLMLLGVVGLIVLANLPAKVRIVPAPDAPLGPELRTIAEKERALGFLDVGPPMRVGLSPPALLLAFVHRKDPVYATAFRPEAAGAKVAFDFVSILEGGRGALTSAETPNAAVLPTPPGGLRQVFPQAYVETVFERHQEALAWLHRQGVTPRAVSAGTFAEDLQRSLAAQRKSFLAAPLRTTLVVLWRSLTKRHPDLGSIESRPGARRVVEWLAAGGSDSG
jgi:hypothetical protein